MSHRDVRRSACHGCEREITRFRTRKTASLLAYLACHPETAHPRDDLVELFWPESDASAGRTNLRVALTALRRELDAEASPEDALLQTDHFAVRLDPSRTTTDVADFGAALDAADEAEALDAKVSSLACAIELYRGRFMAGHYDDWALAEQDRLAGLQLSALSALTDLLAGAGQVDRAIGFARRAVEADPLEEAYRVRLMRLLIDDRRPSAALQQ